MEEEKYEPCRKNNRIEESHEFTIYFEFYISSLMTIVMLTEVTIRYGAGETLIYVFQLPDYIPQAIFIPIAPFLNLFIFQERTSRKRKIIKYIVVIVLFTASLLVTLTVLIPQLAELYGTAELFSYAYPIWFYMNAAVAIIGEIKGWSSE